MYRLDKCILVTNNDRVYLKYRDEIKCILLDNYEDVLLIEKCLEVFKAWQNISVTPQNYENKVSEDFKTIDLSVIENIIPRIF